jgi:uncharacterized protein YecT (DUF1311 family)
VRRAAALGVLMLLATGCGSHTAATTSGGPIDVPSMDGPPVHEPMQIDLSSDGGDDWAISKWLSYGGRTARASAQTESNDCVPDCATGTRALATTTIVFSGEVPCYGRLAYAQFTVARTSNRSVAAVGSGRDLTGYCGYVAFRTGLACLARARRAVGVREQERCFDGATGSTQRRIDRERRAIASPMSAGGRHALAESEEVWSRYRRASCVAMASIYGGGSYGSVLRAACLYDRTRAHLADLTARHPFAAVRG